MSFKSYVINRSHNAKVISECYGGERFGKGIYYRLVYGTKQKEQWEIFLVFEEKLIVNTIGSMLAIESDTEYTKYPFPVSNNRLN